MRRMLTSQAASFLTDAAVTIFAPRTATNGTLQASQLEALMASDAVEIKFYEDRYYLSNDKRESGYLVYTCQGYNEGVFSIKAITITLSTRGWVLTSKTL